MLLSQVLESDLGSLTYTYKKAPMSKDMSALLFWGVSRYGFSGVTVTPLTGLFDSISFLIRPCD